MKRSLARLAVENFWPGKPSEVVAAHLERLHRAAESLGVKLESPFMQLAFLPLAVIPELRITDRGLVDVERQKIVSLLVR